MVRLGDIVDDDIAFELSSAADPVTVADIVEFEPREEFKTIDVVKFAFTFDVDVDDEDRAEATPLKLAVIDDIE